MKIATSSIQTACNKGGVILIDFSGVLVWIQLAVFDSFYG